MGVDLRRANRYTDLVRLMGIEPEPVQEQVEKLERDIHDGVMRVLQGDASESSFFARQLEYLAPQEFRTLEPMSLSYAPGSLSDIRERVLSIPGIEAAELVEGPPGMLLVRVTRLAQGYDPSLDFLHNRIRHELQDHLPAGIILRVELATIRLRLQRLMDRQRRHYNGRRLDAAEMERLRGSTLQILNQEFPDQRVHVVVSSNGEAGFRGAWYLNVSVTDGPEVHRYRMNLS